MRSSVAVAGVGELGRYIVEELLEDNRYQVLVIARKINPWLQVRGVNVVTSDYSEGSIVQALNDFGATALISTINCSYDQYYPVHNTLLNACIKSTGCKRFIPGEYAGNVRDFPHLPRFFAASRQPLRELLQRSGTGIEYTLLQVGWLMDYFLPASKTHIHPITHFPVDANSWRAWIMGTGDEIQSWTCARNIGQAVAELLAAKKWEPVTYLAGEWGTFNQAIKIMENTYGKKMPVEHKPADSILPILDKYSKAECAGPGTDGEIAEVQEWMVEGGAACPRELTLEQRHRYFRNVGFLTLEGLLRHAQDKDFV